MTYAPKIQGDFALNQIVVHLALVTRSIAGPGNQAIQCRQTALSAPYYAGISLDLP